jgi:hypothetical protein
MSLRFGVPTPVRVVHPELFVMGVLVSLSAVLIATFAVDKLGSAMFKRGFAKPFYIKGHRVHHRSLYLIVPALYTIFLSLYVMGYIRIQWGSLWDNLAYTIVILAITMSIDFLGDKFWPKIRKNVILHHEWIYALVPAYVLTYVLVVII